MNTPFVRVLGTADWQQTKGNDGSCYTVNDIALIDANSCLIMNLLNQDIDPLTIPTIFFTHMHADHYMGLAPLLLYWRTRKSSLEGLTLVGPKETIKASFERALNYAFHDSRNIHAELAQMPTIIECSPGDIIQIPGFEVSTMASDHAVPGLCYRFHHLDSQKSVGFSGDTRYLPSFASFFNHVDLLLFEASFGTSPLPPSNEFSRHVSVVEAVQVAQEANAKKLLLTHMQALKREATIAKAKALTSLPVELAAPFERYSF